MLFFSRINVFSLVREHFLTLYDNRTGKTNWLEVFLLSFFTLAIPAVLVLWLKQPIEPTGNDCFLTVFSIAVGFLSSTLFVLADRKTSVREANSVTRLKECFYNTAFALISALFVIFCYILMIILLRAFRDFNLAVNSGEMLCVSGQSGSGKSTLFNIIGMFEQKVKNPEIS